MLRLRAWAPEPPLGGTTCADVLNEIMVSKGAMGTKPNDLPRKYTNKDSTD